MIRYNVFLTEQQLKKLKALKKPSGITTADIIRQAIDNFLKQQHERD